MRSFTLVAPDCGVAMRKSPKVLSFGAMIVAWPDGFSASGILALLDTVDQVRHAFNPDLALDGLVINHVRHTAGHRGYTDVFGDIYGEILLQPPLPVRSVISDARDAAMPVEFYERRYRTSSKAAPLFREIAAHAGGEACVSDRTDVCDLTGPTISHHLKVLREAGLISGQRRGTWIYYRVHPEALGRLSAVLVPENGRRIFWSVQGWRRACRARRRKPMSNACIARMKPCS